MRPIKILLSALTVLFLMSCKNDGKEKETTEESGKLPETFNVSFNVTVKKDDTFQLYYTEDKTLNFGDAMSVKTLVKGSDLSQEILFKLPVDVVPTNIRLDLGDNKEQGSVVMHSMKLKYFNNIFEAKENLTKKYFYFQENQLKYDEATSTLTLVNTEGQTYDPLMWSNELLGVELEKLVK